MDTVKPYGEEVNVMLKHPIEIAAMDVVTFAEEFFKHRYGHAASGIGSDLAERLYERCREIRAQIEARSPAELAAALSQPAPDPDSLASRVLAGIRPYLVQCLEGALEVRIATVHRCIAQKAAELLKEGRR